MKCRIPILLGIVILFCLLIVSSCSDDSTKPNKVENPIFSLPTGTYNTFLQVEISCATDDADIRYTTDGKEPTEVSDLYSQAIEINSNTIVRARAFKDNYRASSISIVDYELVLPAVAKPTFTPNAGTFNFPQDITINCETADAEIYFTLDGTRPTTSSNLFIEPINIYTDTTIRAKAFKTSYNASEISTAEYIIDSLKVTSPIFSPEANMYNEEQTITIFCTTNGAEIRYTDTGLDPTITSPLYSIPFEIDTSTIIKARAFKDGYLPSSIIMAEYEIDYIHTAIPIFSPTPGTYDGEQEVTLGTTTEEAEIHYTLDGSEPNENSPLYNNYINISSTTIIKAIAMSNDYLPSVITTALYEISYPTVSTPQFNPAPGVYVGEQVITITSTTPDAMIYYTLDGSEPDETSPLYNSPVNITSNTSIKARAYEGNLLASAVGVGDYQIFDQVVATPQFTPIAGTYSDEQIVSISCSTPDATIYYTLDSTQPSQTSETYTNPLNINSSTIIKARAFADNSLPSEIATGNFMIGNPIPYSFAMVEGGTFNNGTADITISDFYICEHEVTQYEYVALMSYNPSYHLGTYKPVETISWFNAIEYCNFRSIYEGLTPCYSYNNEGTNPSEWSEDWNTAENNENVSCDFTANGYRLPTEMEWMYAAKGGNQTPATGYNEWAGTNDANNLTNYAWYSYNNDEISPSPVKTKLPNELQIWDMSGNINEWCWDIFGDYDTQDQTDPLGASSGSQRLVRGGDFASGSGACTVDFRLSLNPASKYGSVGFRVARSIQ